jgi:hypothetical protein
MLFCNGQLPSCCSIERRTTFVRLAPQKSEKTRARDTNGMPVSEVVHTAVTLGRKRCFLLGGSVYRLQQVLKMTLCSHVHPRDDDSNEVRVRLGLTLRQRSVIPVCIDKNFSDVAFTLSSAAPCRRSLAECALE